MEVNLTKNEISEVSEWNIWMYDQWNYIGSAWYFHNISVWKDNYLICYNDDGLVGTFVSTFKTKSKVEEVDYWIPVPWAKDIELFIDNIRIDSINYRNWKIPEYEYTKEELKEYFEKYNGSPYDVPF